MTSNRDPRRIFWTGLAIMLVLIGVAAVLGVIFNTHNYTVNGLNWLGIASGIAGTLIGLFVLFIFIWFIVWIFRFVGWSSRSWKYYSGWWGHDEAMEILRERYAKGEISKEEYDKMMNDLQRNKGMNL
ncbi:MAG: SHOCT domain-containing protein [Candidatus Thermoplasmatota archaeon]|jgi:putative membrane protein|nr:SHOCT domain-containing protein [Candidatus Thermoplasmatota archaeon]MCL5790078.1 SHOCT domain-containing protein [Candidatus Thermoplasmatota archaeon]